jgi:hypothetical protein
MLQRPTRHPRSMQGPGHQPSTAGIAPNSDSYLHPKAAEHHAIARSKPFARNATAGCNDEPGREARGNGSPKGMFLQREVSRSASMAARFRELHKKTSGDFLPKLTATHEASRDEQACLCLELRIAICRAKGSRVAKARVLAEKPLQLGRM